MSSKKALADAGRRKVRHSQTIVQSDLGLSCSHAPHDWCHIAIQADSLFSAGEGGPVLSCPFITPLLVASGNAPVK